MKCVVCGESFIFGRSHARDPKVEARIESSRKSHGEMGIERRQSFTERLADGFNVTNSEYPREQRLEGE
jgi:hypothetical protein